MSILDINQMLKKVTKKRGPMLYSYLEPMGDFKTGLRLVVRDEDILCMCEWVPRFKVIEFYYEDREKKEIIQILKNQPYMELEPKKSFVVIEQLDDDNSDHYYATRKIVNKQVARSKKPLLLGWHGNGTKEIDVVSSQEHEETLEDPILP